MEREDFNSESAFLKALEHEAWEEYLDVQEDEATCRHTVEGIGYAMTLDELVAESERLGLYELGTKPASSGWTQEQLESWLEYYRHHHFK